ncbi:MAG: hypothetical protein HC818_08270 [Synechococcaceae cyanobacterium RM1_1_27]|nr:hypothetical protein [Synechococcaceae cyanobacterium RM1_1_27]
MADLERDPWQNRVALLATQHHKEQVITPLLAKGLGIQVRVVAVDTDQFGTFSRERPRPGNVLETLRLKIEAGLQGRTELLGLASEGSFGPHPQIPGIPWNQEWVMLIDGEQNLELWGWAASVQTNFSHRWVNTVAEALDFAQQVGFPDHALIALDDPTHPQWIQKGIQDQATLVQVVQAHPNQGIHLETDMRAMVNPSRMQVIATATQDLIQKAQSLCPACSTPGYDQIRPLSGLRCRECGSPTAVTKAWVYGCLRCPHTETMPVPEAETDPVNCAFCNP